MNRKCLFIWVLSIGTYDRVNNRLDTSKRYPMVGCGSDYHVLLDGRLSRRSIIALARKLTKERGGIGFSVGWLECYDPDDSYAQAIIPFTKI
jgi:hypothetical protein